MNPYMNYSQAPLSYLLGEDVYLNMKGLADQAIKNALNPEQLQYYQDNFEQFTALATQNNLNMEKLIPYIKDLFANKDRVNVEITPETCKKKIIDSLQFDFEEFGIQIGTAHLKVVKQGSELYKVFQPLEEGQTQNSSDIAGYKHLFDLTIPGLNLKEIDW